ncbi:DUF3515 family protein [Streptomyces ossamyceticus]|nr:DUF3515 family protein [Streptomyces ossamyceticus]
MLRRTRIALLATGAVALVTAATVTVRVLGEPTYSFAAAPRAGDPACARVSAQYPDRLAGLDRADTDTKGAAVYGDGSIVVRCGFPSPRPTEDPCTQVDGVDWVWRADERREGRQLLITYGREPAVEVQVAPDRAATDAVLVGLSGIVKPLEQSGECLSLADTP